MIAAKIVAHLGRTATVVMRLEDDSLAMAEWPSGGASKIMPEHLRPYLGNPPERFCWERLVPPAFLGVMGLSCPDQQRHRDRAWARERSGRRA